MNLQEQIKRLMETRTAKALELEGVQKKALDEGRTKDESEREVFKGLTADIAQIDAELDDLRALEALQVTKAVPAAGSGSAAGAGAGAVARGAIATGAGPAIHMNKDADEKFKGQNYTRIVIAKANASAAATNQNATAAGERAVASAASATASTQQADAAMGYRNQASNAATTAGTHAGNASTSANQAEASRIEASKLNLGAKAVAPTVDNQGAALLKGATYMDTSVTPNRWRAWNGTQWVDPVNVTGAVNTVNGKSGPDVTLVPADVGALPATGAIAVGGSVRAPRVAVAALAIDCSTGNYFAKTVAANSTFTFTGVPASGNAYSMNIDVTHTSGVITWPAAVKWPGDAAPSLTTGRVHRFMFATSDGGATWRGAALSNYAS